MVEHSVTGIDPTIFGYRYIEAEKARIHFDTIDDVSKSFLGEYTKTPKREVNPQIPASEIESLPLEIIHDILADLDMISLLSLRLVNSNVARIVRAFPALRDLVTYAPQLLKALSQTGLGRRYSVGRLHSILRSDRCAYCKDYGPLLYMLQCLRCCLHCSLYYPRLISTTMQKAQNTLGVPMPLMQNLIEMHTIADTAQNRGSVGLISLQAVMDLKNMSISDRQLERFLNHVLQFPLRIDQRRYCLHAFVAVPFVEFDETGPVLQHGIWCRGCDDTFRFHHRYGFGKNGCDEEEIHYQQSKAYSREEFVEHCKECSEVRRLKNLGYPKVIEELEYWNSSTTIMR